MNHLNDFITGLQFLSRIRLWPQKKWAENGFGRSVKWFPLVGLCIGLGDALVWWICSPYFSGLPLGIMLLLSHFFWAGAICYDGLMDVADGVFSGRPREQMLEIMKDSRSGAFGVLAGAVALLIRVVFLGTLPEITLLPTIVFVPVLSRWLMAGGVSLFPYARNEGLGGMFSNYSGAGSFSFATLLVVLIFSAGLVRFSPDILSIILITGILSGLGIAFWLSRKLKGLTGDCYGAITESSELIMFIVLVGFGSAGV